MNDQVACSDQASAGTAGETAEGNANKFTESMISNFQAIPIN